MVDAIISSAIKWISSQLVEEAKFLYGVEDQMLKLQNDFKCMQRYLQDAEESQLHEKENGQVTIFIETIREIAFRAEDVIDTYILKVSSDSKFTRFAYFRPITYETHVIGKQIEKIQNDIKNAAEGLKIFKNLGEPSSSHDQLRPQRRVLESYAHVEEDYVVGLDDNIKDLVQRITSGMEEEAEWVVSIIGHGGIGKTTLAKKIYNHGDIIHKFSCRAWVSISQQWNKRDVLLEILRQIRNISNEERILMQSMSDREVIEKMHCFLNNNRYLLVLDDIWVKEAWDDFFPAFPRNRGSKIIITTRNPVVPRYADQNCFIYRPDRLTTEQGLEIFSKLTITFENARFKKLGSAMIEKCAGFPLAIVTLAGLLRTKQGLDEWERVHKAFKSIIMRAKESAVYGRSINEAFQLSYHYLPQHLKSCFLYLAIFPEDYNIPTRSLTQMWIAEGLVTANDKLLGDDMLEEIAEQFLEELLLRCMVQVARRNHMGKVKACRMHDLMREFCIAKAKEQHLVEIFSPPNSVAPSTSENSRRVIIDSSIECSRSHAHTRSLIKFEQSNFCEISSLRLICEDFKLLRVLNLWRLLTKDRILPKEIGNLIHLRYLGLRETNICELPESIGNLRNLLTLDYRIIHGSNCKVIVPNVLWKMEDLRHLYLPCDGVYPQNTLHWKMENFRHTHLGGRLDQLVSMNKLKLSTLKNLQTLWGLSVTDHMMEELKGLCQCLRKLWVYGISSEEQLTALFQSPSFTSGGLRNIFLNFYRNSVQLESLEPLYMHCQNLQKLNLCGKIREESVPLRFSPNLVVLKLHRTGLKLQDSITAIGQLHYLKSLTLSGYSYVGNQLIFNASEFSQLEELSLEDLYELKALEVEERSMPQLKRLHIRGCFGLKRLPQGLRYMTMLQELKLTGMAEKFCSRLRRPSTTGSERFKEGKDFHIIKHIPSVQIRNY